MTNNTATAAPTTSAEKLAAALDAATEPMTQAALAAAAGVGRSTATTWLGQQVAKGLAVRTMHDKAPATFARPAAQAETCDECHAPTYAHDLDCAVINGTVYTPAAAEVPEVDDPAVAEFVAALDTMTTPAQAAAAMGALLATEEATEAGTLPACDVCLSTGPHTADCSEGPGVDADEDAAQDAAWRAEQADATVVDTRQVPAPAATVPGTCHCGDDTVGHVHPTRLEKAAAAANATDAARPRRTRTGGAANAKAAAWVKAEEALTAAGPEGLPVPGLWQVLQDAGLALSGAYALVNAKRTDGTLVTATDARVLKDRRYALATR